MADERKSVLVLEDHADSLELLRMMLERDYRVHGCLSSMSAVECALLYRPAVLLLDIGLPHMDGIQCLHEIRKLDGLADIPAVALTAYAYPADRARFTAAGFQSVISKPVMDFDLVIRTIEEVTGISELREGKISE